MRRIIHGARFRHLWLYWFLCFLGRPCLDWSCPLTTPAINLNCQFGWPERPNSNPAQTINLLPICFIKPLIPDSIYFSSKKSPPVRDWQALVIKKPAWIIPYRLPFLGRTTPYAKVPSSTETRTVSRRGRLTPKTNTRET